MRPYLALTSLLFGLHLGVAAVAALDLPAPVLGLAAFAAGACLGLGLSLLARRLPLPHLLLFALLAYLFQDNILLQQLVLGQSELWLKRVLQQK